MSSIFPLILAEEVIALEGHLRDRSFEASGLRAKQPYILRVSLDTASTVCLYDIGISVSDFMSLS